VQAMTPDYYDRKAMSATAIKAGRKSMKQMHHAMTAPTADTPALMTGRLIHAAILEPDDYARNLRTFDGPKRGKAWAEFKAGNDPKWTVGQEEAANQALMQQAVIRHPVSSKILADIVDTEMEIYWRDDEVGDCKCKLDAYTPAYGRIELKSTSYIEPSRFSSQAYKLGYHLQFGWYHHGADTDERIKNTFFHVIAVESKAPYDVAVYRVDDSILRQGYDQAKEIALKYRQAEKLGRFPGVARELMAFELPAWATGASMDSLDMSGLETTGGNTK